MPSFGTLALLRWPFLAAAAALALDDFPAVAVGEALPAGFVFCANPNHSQANAHGSQEVIKGRHRRGHKYVRADCAATCLHQPACTCSSWHLAPSCLHPRHLVTQPPCHTDTLSPPTAPYHTATLPPRHLVTQPPCPTVALPPPHTVGGVRNSRARMPATRVQEMVPSVSHTLVSRSPSLLRAQRTP